jgi:hypothetical protein
MTTEQYLAALKRLGRQLHFLERLAPPTREETPTHRHKPAVAGAKLFGLEVALSQLASPFGLLDVEQSQLGWLAYRHARPECRCPLLRDGKPAIFATCEEAQQAAEAHLCDGLPDMSPNAPRGELVYCTVPADGLSWAAVEAVE